MDKSTQQKLDEFKAELADAIECEKEADDTFQMLLKKADHEVEEYNGVSALTVKQIASHGILLGSNIFRRNLLQHNVNKYQEMLDAENNMIGLFNTNKPSEFPLQ